MMENNALKISVDTSVTLDGRIIQENYTENNGIRENFIRSIFDTKEKQFKEALIKLGWTPPEETAAYS